MNTVLKKSGTAAQKAILDQYALSQNQARSLSQQLLSDLSAIKGSSRMDTNIATTVLFKMNVSPVAVATYGFGGDNHSDAGLTGEATQTVDSIAALQDLITRLGAPAYQLQAHVTIAIQNVFGRTLSVLSRPGGNADGRDHNANHHCSVLIGSGIKSSLVGGVTLQTNGKGYRAQGLDSTTGAANDSGDVAYAQTLGSMGKTLGAAVGVDQTYLETQITLGKVIKAALA